MDKIAHNTLLIFGKLVSYIIPWTDKLNHGLRNNCRKRDTGFTLIELVVATALISTVSVISLVAFRQYSESQKLQNSALDVMLLLQKAKSRSLTQVKPRNIVICQSNALYGYEVRICNLPLSGCSGVGRYELHVLCGNSSSMIEAKQLPNTVNFNNLTSPVFLFRVISGSSTSGNIILDSYGLQKIIRVNPSGIITLQ